MRIGAEGREVKDVVRTRGLHHPPDIVGIRDIGLVQVHAIGDCADAPRLVLRPQQQMDVMTVPYQPAARLAPTKPLAPVTSARVFRKSWL